MNSDLPNPPNSRDSRVGATEPFVNRDEPIEIFKNAVSDIDHERTRQVLCFHGMGGQGKTYLCNHFSEMLSAQPCEVAPNLRWGAINLRDYSERQSADFLLGLRNALKKAAKSKVSFPAFDFAFGLFWEETHLNRSLPKIEHPWWEEFSVLSGSIIATTVELIGVPWVSSIIGRFGRIAVKRVKSEILLRTNESLKYLVNDGKLLPAHEIESWLPFLFARDLDDWRAENPNDRFIVMMDEYESTLETGGADVLFRSNKIDDTVRELVERCRATLFVFFSREKLEWDATERSWAAVLDGRQHPLNGLSHSYAEQFLKLARVDNADIRMAMIEGASANDPKFDEKTCYPMMLKMQVELYRRLTAFGKPVVADHFRIEGENFDIKRRALLARLLGSYSSNLQYTLCRLSVPRYFNENIFKYLIAKFQIGQPADTWTSVQALSLVQHGTAEGVCTFHSVIREGLLATLRPDQREATHSALFEYFKHAMTPSSGEKVGAAQAAAATEAFYHIRAVEPKVACHWWRDARRSFGGLAIDRFVEDLDRANAALAAQIFEEVSLEHAERLFDLGQNLHAQGRYEDAEKLYRQALTIFESAGADTCLTAALVLHNFLDYQRKHSEAESFHRRSLTIRQDMLEAGDHDIALSLAALGTNLNHQGLYPEAENLIRKALDIVGENDLNSPTILDNLGLCLGFQNRFVEAELAHRKGLAFRERALDPGHHMIAESLAYLGYTLYRQKQYAEAEPLIRRALEIALASYGPDDRRTAIAFYEFGRMFYDQGRYEEALPAYRQALAIRERALGPAHPYTAESVGWVGWTLYRAGQKAEALIYLQRALEIRETVLGRDHPQTRISAQHLLEAEGGPLTLKVTTSVRGMNELGSCAPNEFSHVVSILDPGTADPVWPEVWSNIRKLVLRFHDATTALPTATMFASEHLEELLRFADQVATADAGALLLHSALGISRSTACAGIVQAHLARHYSGVALFREILRSRDIAWPNLHIVELGDARLARGGDLIAGAKAVYRYQLQKHPDWAERLTRAGRGREVAAAAEGVAISL